ncbi:MAG: hypothetical protein ACP5UQ_13545 [Anaerolineae bacterium]
MNKDEIVRERLQYLRHDDTRVCGILEQRLGDFDAFARGIADYLSRP